MSERVRFLIVISFILYRPYSSPFFILAPIASQRALSWHSPVTVYDLNDSVYARFCPVGGARVLACGPYKSLCCRGTEMSDKHFLLWTHRSAFMLSAVASSSPQSMAVKDGGNIEFFIPRRDFGYIRHTFFGGLFALKSRSKRPSGFRASCQSLSFHLAYA